MTAVCRITDATGRITSYTDLDDAYIDIARAALRNEATMLLGVVGSRRRATNDDAEIVHEAIDRIHEDCPAFGRLVLVSGACPTGADHMAYTYARNHHLAIIEFPAQWDVYGKRAGFVRNEYIARLAHQILAAVAPDRTGGTENTIAHARRLQRPVVLV